ncbi:MAG: biosynthetic-type acetolactate synthase large subunit [Oscillospiraceae bacterium]|jgi:acetolactate synthase-1/2/3 large subunit|nr:biosynthetic-type acetolactate synthase large subunit [Oscillospiraceae bacterium]
MNKTGSQIIIETLAEHGVKNIFGYPGGSVLNIYDELYKNSDRITHFLTSHEQHAGHAADGYARATGEVGVVLATSGPGATNLVTPIATAYMDSVPLVALTGNVERKLIGKDSFQEVNTTGITMPVTKHNYLVSDIDDLADNLRNAFRIANSGRKGPVLVDIPKDITAAVTDFESRAPIEQALPELNREQVEQAVSLINESVRPFIYTGGGVISSNASEQLAEFAKKIKAPVSSSLMAQGAFDQRDPAYIGMLGMHGTLAAAKAIKECDLLIVLGARFSDRVIGDPKKFASHANVIHVDIDSAEHNKNIIPEAIVLGDVKHVLSAFAPFIKEKTSNVWLDSFSEYRRDRKLNIHQIATTQYPVTPQAVLETLDDILDDNFVVTTEVGQSQMWAAMYLTYRSPRSFVSSGGLGTMGYGLGAAIGAAVGKPDSTIINIAGDGSFAMNVGELFTLSKYGFPVVQIVFNNSVLGMVRQWQTLFYGKRYSQTTLAEPNHPNVDYGKLADAFGLSYFLVDKAESIRPSLEKALSLGKPVLIECVIDTDMAVLPMTPAGKDITSPMLTLE